MEPLGLQRSILTFELEFYPELLHPLLNYTFHVSQLRTAALALKMSITHLLWPEEKNNVSITFLLSASSSTSLHFPYVHRDWIV